MFVHWLLLALLMPLQAANPADKPATIPDGLLFNCWIRRDLSTTKSKVGDPVELEVVNDVTDAAGKLVLPARAKLTGTVTMVQKRSGNEQPGLAIRVTEAHWKDGSAILNGVFGGDVMLREHLEGMTGTNMTTHRGGDTFSTEGFEQVEGFADSDDRLGAILHARHDIKLGPRNVVSIRTLP